jgi:DNA polymerase I
MKTLLLIDANSLVHRCFHALPPLSTKDGVPSQALYGISSILIKLWRDDRPDFAAACFDRPEPTFRRESYAEYKAHRPSAPDELVSQLIAAHELFNTFGIRTFDAAGWEADDLIATLARRFAEAPDVRVVILTGDLDTLQLVVDDKVVVRTFRKGLSDTFIYNDAAVRERYGLSPDQVVDYKAMVGDVSDNIKGIPGVGPKTAQSLLQKYGHLEDILAALDTDEKLMARLGPHREQALRSKDLVTLRSYEPLPAKDLADLRVEVSDEEILAYFRKHGFETLAQRFLAGPVEARPAKPEKPQEPSAPQGSMF